MDTVEGMRVFVKVVEEQGFSSASRKIGLSKSLVSKYVQQLEERLNVRLLERTTRGIRLTNSGAEYYQRCRRLLQEFDEMETQISQQHLSPRGLLRVTAPQTFGELYVVDAVAEFMAKYPEIQVDLNLSDHFVHLVEEGYDVAIRIANLPDSSLIARQIAPCPLITFATPEYLEIHGAPQTPWDLKLHRCIIDTNLRVPNQWIFQGSEGAFSVSVSGPIRVNSILACRELALKGFGIARSPFFVVLDEVKQGRLIPILHEFEFKSIGIYTLYPQNLHLSTRVRLFLDYLVETMKTEVTW